MATSRENLKGYFNTNDRPTESQFSEFIDSAVHLEEDKASTPLVESGIDDNKFVTPAGAKASVMKFAPVKTVNGLIPNSSGNVSITNITGTASTITGEISQNQVTDLVGDLNSKQDVLVSGSNIKTVNGNSILGSGNIGFVNLIAMPSSSFTLQDTTNAQNAFPSGCDEFTLSSNKTYFLKGKFIMSFTGTTSRITSMGWSVSGGLNVQSIEYVANSIFTNGNNVTTATQNSTQISGVTSRKVIVLANTSTSLVVEFEGVLRCSSGGKLIPQVTFSVAPGGTTLMNVGSYIHLTEIGDNNVQTIGAVS